MRLRRGRKGLSALFDAVLFFIIILAATGALFWWASAVRAGTADEAATRDLGRTVVEVQSAALECTVGPVEYSAGGEVSVFNGTVCECLRTMFLCRAYGAGSDTEELEDAVRGIYALLVERPLHFEVRASARGLGPDLVISDSRMEKEALGAVRWTCAVPLIVDGLTGELALSLWR